MLWGKDGVEEVGRVVVMRRCSDVCVSPKSVEFFLGFWKELSN